jgi:hypothetical protein
MRHNIAPSLFRSNTGRTDRRPREEVSRIVSDAVFENDFRIFDVRYLLGRIARARECALRAMAIGQTPLGFRN